MTGEQLPSSPVPQEIIVPGTGALVDLNDENSIVTALADLRQHEMLVRGVKAALTEAFIERTKALGRRTLHLEDGRVASLSSSEETEYDAEEIEVALRALGMPEERIREIVEERVSYKVKAVEMKRAAAANPDYDRIMQENSRKVEKNIYVKIARGSR